METFAMVLASILFIGIFVGFIYLVAKRADRIIRSLREPNTIIRNTHGLSISDLHKEVQRGGKFVIFQFCIMSGVWESKIYFIRAWEWTAKYSIGYIARTVIWIWLSPLSVIRSIHTNLKGGKDVTESTLKSLIIVDDAICAGHIKL